VERREFCEITLSAASKMGFVAKLDQVQGHYILHLGDTLTNKVISGSPMPTKEEALESACNALVDHIKLEP
jgi:hypothetical protein